MAGSQITGTNYIAGSPTAYPGGATQLTPAIQTLWSKEILFQAMPILRMEQFAIKKTELGNAPGTSVNFMRYNNLSPANQLVEGIRMVPQSMTGSQFSIQVAEHGKSVATTEFLLNASFDDIMATAARLLGRNMALYLDGSARDTMLQASSILFGYNKPALSGALRTPLSPYDHGVPATQNTDLVAGNYAFTTALVKDATLTLAQKNTPRLGDTYVCFINPGQSRELRDDPEFIEVSKYAQPGSFMLGEVGRYNDAVFIETTQVEKKFVSGSSTKTYMDAIMIGDNAFGHAISLPVELRDSGILDYGREHGLAWYSIWGFGLITDKSVVILETNLQVCSETN